MAMLYPFFAQAARSPGRQAAFRTVVAVHLALLAAGVWSVGPGRQDGGALVLGQMLLITGIVEGAVVLGWRLTQLPKSQALEFLLVSSLRPWAVFLAEALVGLGRLALVNLAGLPVLALLAAEGRLDPLDLVPLAVMPVTWGAVTGLGLAVWAYEPHVVRYWGERLLVALVIFYLVVGVLAGEHLRAWLAWFSDDFQLWFLNAFAAFHTYNPFAVLATWTRYEPAVTWERALGLELAALLALAGLLARGAGRLKGHFHELHYRPVVDRAKKARPAVGDRPLAWWAVRRVTRYSGRINLWLAGGFFLLYAVYTVLGPAWPAWLGRNAFLLVDALGGIPACATGLVVLAAVPAAFQYGLWDSNAPDRCRRLELLLLTRLRPNDYWHAAAAAAWKRGWGYFAVAAVLWAAALLAKQATAAQVMAAAAAAVLLWGLYFALGFHEFARGQRANALGMLLTLGLPFLAFACHCKGWPDLAALVPPGSVYQAGAGEATLRWLVGPLLSAALTLTVARYARAHCDRLLRAWYEAHHGRKVVD